MNLTAVEAKKFNQLYPSSSNYFLSFDGEVLRFVLPGFFRCLVYPLAGLAPAKTQTYSTEAWRLKGGVFNPRTTDRYIQDSPKGQRHKSWESGGTGRRYDRRVCKHSREKTAVVVPLAGNSKAGMQVRVLPLPPFLSDHGSRWGMRKLTSLKNIGSGKSSFNANCFSQGINPDCLFSALE